MGGHFAVDRWLLKASSDQKSDKLMSYWSNMVCWIRFLLLCELNGPTDEFSDPNLINPDVSQLNVLKIFMIS